MKFCTYASRLRGIARTIKALCKRNADEERYALTFDSEIGGGLVGVALAGDLAGVLHLDTVDDELPLLALFDDYDSAAAFRYRSSPPSNGHGHAFLRLACTGLSHTMVRGCSLNKRENTEIYIVNFSNPGTKARSPPVLAKSDPVGYSPEKS